MDQLKETVAAAFDNIVASALDRAPINSVIHSSRSLAVQAHGYSFVNSTNRRTTLIRSAIVFGRNRRPPRC